MPRDLGNVATSLKLVCYHPWSKRRTSDSIILKELIYGAYDVITIKESQLSTYETIKMKDDLVLCRSLQAEECLLRVISGSTERATELAFPNAGQCSAVSRLSMGNIHLMQVKSCQPTFT